MYELIKKILEGDKLALEKLVKNIQSDILNISFRFLWTREDAEDATQEIIIKVIANLGTFKGNSKFSTWMYRIAVNHLLNIKKSNLEKQLSFTAFGEDLLNGLQARSYDEPDKDLLAEEVKIGCTLGMLICLDRDLRISYILGEVFELTSKEAAEILDIKAENFRKRLSKARVTLRNFMKSYCGLTNKNNACRCDKRINYAISNGRVDPKKLNFISHDTLAKSKTEMEELYTASAIFRSHPLFVMNKNKHDEILNVIGNLKGLLSR